TVVLEAGALHIATIGTKINGLIDSVVDGVTGVLVAPQSSSDLEKTMNLFLETPNVISYYGGNAFARVKEHFDSKIVYKSLSDFYKSSNAKGVK
ncbi:MAG: glycosyltransferase, partial [Bdellovibrio sp.]|nr:glycosyltransferase [Bdellovibrio sp.]